jgi:hypothetical protein
MIEQANIATTAGTLGPYSVPADFSGLMHQKRLHKPWSLDRYAVPPSMGDDENGRRNPIYRNEADGGLYFFLDPGTKTHVLTYLRKATLADLANWPDDQWVKTILTYYTAFFALHLTEDFREQAKSHWDLADALTTKEWQVVRRGQSRPDSRTLLDTNGNPAWYALEGDSR